MKKLIPAFIFICLLSSFAGADDDTLRFQHPIHTNAYNNSLIQDRDGFLWIGCGNGIIRYDGYELISYKAGEGSLSSNYTPGLFEDDEGLLWIGSMGGGLNVFDKKSIPLPIISMTPVLLPALPETSLTGRPKPLPRVWTRPSGSGQPRASAGLINKQEYLKI